MDRGGSTKKPVDILDVPLADTVLLGPELGLPR